MSAQNEHAIDRNNASAEIDERTRQLERAGLVEEGATPAGQPSVRVESTRRTRQRPGA